MSTALIDIAYADVRGFPPGAAVDHVVVTVTGAATPAVSQSVPPETAEVNFSVVPDQYTYTIQAVDAAGAPYGTAVTGSFVATAPVTVTLRLPASAVVTVSG